MGGIFSSRIPDAAEEYAALINGNVDLRTHHPASVGGTINSIRRSADTANSFINDVQTKSGFIDLPKIAFATKITAAFGAYMAFQSDLGQKRIASALEGIAKDLSTIAQHEDAKNNSNLAGGEGFPVQILDFANEVARNRNSRFVLAFHASNLPDPAIGKRLSLLQSDWTYLNPQTCFFMVFHDWRSLVTHILLIRRMPDYLNSEPICIIFPSNCSSILNDIFCDIPAKGGLDPDSVSFHGQLDKDGTPLTWLPAELTIAGTPLYAATNVYGLGFISMEKKPANVNAVFFLCLTAGYFLGLSAALAGSKDAAGLFSSFLVSFVLSLYNVIAEDMMVFRKRSCDGMSLMVNRSNTFKVNNKRPFELEGDMSKKSK